MGISGVQNDDLIGLTGGTDLTTIGNNGDRLKVDSTVTGTVSIVPANSGFVFGDITTAATTRVAVRRTAYTEQTTDAQRSIVSSSLNDTLVGTGARTIKIVYYTATFTGPFTEIITLTGTAAVNTIATNICYIENIEVVTVGSGTVNAGIISLKSTIAGGGSTICSINAGDNQTNLAHHHVATNATCYVTSMVCSHNGTTVGSGAVFTLNKKLLNIASSAEIQVSDYVRLYGQSSTFARSYPSQIKVVGPARLIMYVTPESSSSTVYRGSFDYYEVP